MDKELVIVFVKNAQLGKVKTRLAKTIGNKAALAVYSELVKVTENALKFLDTDIQIYFSKHIENSNWNGFSKAIQQGEDLGERMYNAFQNGFSEGYGRIVLIGSDLPDISEKYIRLALEKLKENDTVFGPAEDGGYYLVGLSKMQDCIFKNKPWSQTQLLKETLNKLKQKNISFTTLETLNDIDTFEDLAASTWYRNNNALQEKIKQTHD